MITAIIRYNFQLTEPEIGGGTVFTELRTAVMPSKVMIFYFCFISFISHIKSAMGDP